MKDDKDLIDQIAKDMAFYDSLRVVNKKPRMACFRVRGFSNEV